MLRKYLYTGAQKWDELFYKNAKNMASSGSNQPDELDFLTRTAVNQPDIRHFYAFTIFNVEKDFVLLQSGRCGGSQALSSCGPRICFTFLPDFLWDIFLFIIYK